jgi:hypothetical protein
MEAIYSCETWLPFNRIYLVIFRKMELCNVNCNCFSKERDWKDSQFCKQKSALHTSSHSCPPSARCTTLQHFRLLIARAKLSYFCRYLSYSFFAFVNQRVSATFPLLPSPTCISTEHTPLPFPFLSYLHPLRTFFPSISVPSSPTQIIPAISAAVADFYFSLRTPGKTFVLSLFKHFLLFSTSQIGNIICDFSKWNLDVNLVLNQSLSMSLTLLNDQALAGINSVALSPQANYTDWATATCRRNLMPAFVDRGVSRGQHRGSPTVINLFSRPESLLFFQVSPHLSSQRLSGSRSRPTATQKMW